jgi:hypothetical protein
MSGFTRPKKNIDRAALERFAEGADDRRAALAATPASDAPPAPSHAIASPSSTPAPASNAPSPAPAAPVVAPVVVAPAVAAPQTNTTERPVKPEPVAYDKHQQIQWRVSQSTRDLFERVFANTNVKSKQQLLDSILLPALEIMDEKNKQS